MSLFHMPFFTSYNTANTIHQIHDDTTYLLLTQHKTVQLDTATHLAKYNPSGCEHYVTKYSMIFRTVEVQTELCQVRSKPQHN